MDTYDSDSSDGEETQYTETNVLLGYASKETTDDSFSQLGGYPTWLEEEKAPSGVLAKCKVCNELMSLLLQLNGDLPQRFPGHERRLYIFNCRRKACRRKDGSMRAIRGNRVTKSKIEHSEAAKASPVPEKAPTPSMNVGAMLFGASSSSSSSSSSTASQFSSANPFSAGSSSAAAAPNPFAGLSSLAAKPPQKPAATTITLPETFASKLRVSDSIVTTNDSNASRPQEAWPKPSDFPSPYPKYFLDAEYETLSAPSIPQSDRNLANMDVDGPGVEGSSGGGGGRGERGGGGVEDKELFESSMDKTFQKFADKMEQNPEQVLRYDFGGIPLLYSTTDVVGRSLAPKGATAATNMIASRMPRCGNCGNERAFEVQLTPHAITILEGDDMTIEGMDWGTVILGVCGQDCSPRATQHGHVGYSEEWIGVQWEEISIKPK